ncbi:MAG: RluA family pseudouridine synthase [Bryobacteraceae bacterium]
MTFTVSPSDAGRRVDLFLRDHMPLYSRARLQSWIRGGRVHANGAAVKSSYLLQGNETIDVEPEALPPLKAEPEALPLKILYEDNDVVAIDKPAGMVVHAGAGCRTGTVVNALLHRFKTLSTLGGDMRPGIVHRLDRFTSGVLLAARHDLAHRRLAAQFASRSTEKTYIALVHGSLPKDQGRIEKPIARDPLKRVRMTARLERGRPALTEYRVLRRFEQGFTLVEVRIHTGRTHQIRVHFASLGHPVVGDRLYGAPAKVKDRPPLNRYFLHAQRIRFAHPMTGEPITIESPLPAELEQWIKGLL